MQQRVLATSIVCLGPTDRSVLLSALRDELRPDLHTCERRRAHAGSAHGCAIPMLCGSAAEETGVWERHPGVCGCGVSAALRSEMSRLFGSGARLSATRRRTAG